MGKDMVKTVVKIIEIVEECRMCWKKGAEKYRAALGIQEWGAKWESDGGENGQMSYTGGLWREY